MRFDKYTQKLQSTIQSAQSLAVGRDHTANKQELILLACKRM